MHIQRFARPLLPSVVLAALACGCDSIELPEREPPPEPAQVATPTGPLVYQPAFVWSDRNTSYQGTGFFAKTPSGEVIGVTSAHFIDFDGPALLGAIWLDVKTNDPVARFRHAFGQPGRHPQDDPIDLRMDYLLVHDELPPLERPILELDYRLQPDRRERVWLPDKDEDAPDGYKLAAGTVVESHETHSKVRFDAPIQLQSQSGSPIISQKTGKVIGTLSQGGKDRQGVFILLAPSHALLQAIRNADKRPFLKDVVGKPGATAAP